MTSSLTNTGGWGVVGTKWKVFTCFPCTESPRAVIFVCLSFITRKFSFKRLYKRSLWLIYLLEIVFYIPFWLTNSTKLSTVNFVKLTFYTISSLSSPLVWVCSLLFPHQSFIQGPPHPSIDGRRLYTPFLAIVREKCEDCEGLRRAIEIVIWLALKREDEVHKPRNVGSF